MRAGTIPEFDVYMLILGRVGKVGLGDSYRGAIEVVLEIDAHHGEDSRCDVGVGICNVRGDVLGHTRATNEERNVYVFFEAAAFARIKTVVADVKAIIRGVDDVLDESATCVEHLGQNIPYCLSNCARTAWI